MKKIKEIGTDICKFASSAAVTIKKYSPEIMIVTGVVGTVAGAVLACKATIKAKTVIENAKENLHDIKMAKDCPDLLEHEYTKEDAKKDTAIVVARTSFDLAKLYAPALIIETASIISIFASNNILRKRTAAIGAAYAALDSSFKAYRQRVKERYGEEAENEIRYDIKAEQIEETITDDKGKEKKVKKKVNVAKVVDNYTYIFDHQHSSAWEPDNDYNYALLSAEQHYANDILTMRGHLFLNEVLDRLGFPRTKAGQIVGWVYKPNDASWKGDNYADFRVKEIYIDDENGKPVKKIVLDFNVDGNVLDLI